MEFEIKEYTGKFELPKSGKATKSFILIALSPILLIASLAKKIFGQAKIDTTLELHDYKEISGYKLQRRFINDCELPMDLDIPNKSNDLHFFKIQAKPNIPQLEDKFFEYGNAETDHGLYLISINKKENGMTLWCLDKNNLELQKIKDLPSLSWNLFEEEENVIRLRGDDSKVYYDIFITEKINS